MLLTKEKITQDLVNMLMSPAYRRDLVSMSSVDQGYNQGRKRLRKIWLDTSFVPPFPRRG